MFLHRVEREKHIVKDMILFYCKHHHTDHIPCDDCKELIVYTADRLEKCRYKSNKPVCSKCTTHCYNATNRARIKEIMKWAGPRMIYHRPYYAILHVWDKITH